MTNLDYEPHPPKPRRPWWDVVLMVWLMCMTIYMAWRGLLLYIDYWNLP